VLGEVSGVAAGPDGTTVVSVSNSTPIGSAHALAALSRRGSDADAHRLAPRDVSAGARFQVLNTVAELDTEGEYIVDEDEGVLLFIPPRDAFDGEVEVDGKQFDDSLPKMIEKFQPLPETNQQILFKRIQFLKDQLTQIQDSNLKQNLNKDLERLTSTSQSPQVIQMQLEMINIQLNVVEKTIQQILEQQHVIQAENELKNAIQIKYNPIRTQFVNIMNTFKKLNDDSDDSKYTITMRDEIQSLVKDGNYYIQKLDQLDSMKLEQIIKQIKPALGTFKNLVTELQGRLQAYTDNKIKDTLNKKQRENYRQQLSKLNCYDDPGEYDQFLKNTLTELDIQKHAILDCEAERIGLNCLDDPKGYEKFLESLRSNPFRSIRTSKACDRVTTKYRQNIQQEKK
jgi:hypothetical protein